MPQTPGPLDPVCSQFCPRTAFAKREEPSPAGGCLSTPSKKSKTARYRLRRGTGERGGTTISGLTSILRTFHFSTHWSLSPGGEKERKNQKKKQTKKREEPRGRCDVISVIPSHTIPTPANTPLPIHPTTVDLYHLPSNSCLVTRLKFHTPFAFNPATYLLLAV